MIESKDDFKMDEKCLIKKLMEDPAIKSASEKSKKTEYGANLEHQIYGNVCFDNKGNIVRVTPFAFIIMADCQKHQKCSSEESLHSE